MKVKDAGGTLRSISTMKVKDGTTTRSIVQMKVLDGATLRTVATFVPAMTASAPSLEYATSTTSSFVTSSSVTCTPSGGLSPYTYSWSIISGTAIVSSASSATTTFSKNVSAPDVPEYATARCTVTDSIGTTATADVSLTFELVSTF